MSAPTQDYTVEVVIPGWDPEHPEERVFLGEGSFWDSHRQVLYWIDIMTSRLFVYDPVRKTNDTIKCAHWIGTVVPTVVDGVVLAALANGFWFINTLNHCQQWTGIDPEADRPLNRFNDGKCDPKGNFYAGTMMTEDGVRDPEGSLYCLDTKLQCKRVKDKVIISNGITWNSAATLCYYIDTEVHKVMEYPYSEDGTLNIAGGRVAIELPEEWATFGFDGSTMDSDDNIWIAMWNGSCVAQFNPVTGKLLRKVNVPAKHVTSVAFGGPDLTDMYVTCSSHMINDEKERLESKAGSLFVVRGLGVKGVKSVHYQGPVPDSVK